jgi:DNA polymerase III epsilon subunit-like protein
MSPFLVITLLVALGVLYPVARVVMRRRRIRASRKRARGPLPPAAQRAQDRARELLGRSDVLIAAAKTTSFQASAEVIELALIDTTGAVRLDRVMLPTGTITREAIAAHGIDRDELQRLHAPHYSEVHGEIEATLAAAAVVLAYDAPLERRRLYRTAAGHELELPEVGWECVQVIYAEYSGKRAGNGEGWQRWTLRQAAGREGIPIGKPHLRALGDCRTMLRLLQAITGSDDPAGR